MTRRPASRRRRRARRLALAAAAGVALAAAAPASAQEPGLRLGPCPGAALGPERCGVLSVPVERGNPAAGTFDLQVEVTPARGRRRGTLLLLAGGPGQAGVGLGVGALVRDAAAGWEVVTLDQRGTGATALRCPAFETGPRIVGVNALPGVVAACAEGIGPVRTRFTTGDSVADLEDLRAALGRERWAVAGVSYGTYVALRYAATHPGRVERMVLDSVVGPEGAELLLRETFPAARRVMRALCAGRACRGVTPNLTRDVARLNARLARRALRGVAVDARGRPRRASFGGPNDPGALLALLMAGDVAPAVRGGFPAAVRAALRGDAGPLLRLQATAAEPEALRRFSPALYTATVCLEARVPWAPGTPPGERLEIARRAALAVPAGTYRPFGPSDALFGDVLAGCAGWPESPLEALAPAAPLPQVPTLIMGGSDDLRTPLAEGRRLAAALPRATLVAVPWGGHSVLSSSECAQTALGRFLAGRPVGQPCRGAGARPPIDPLPPRSASDLAVPPRQRGRAALALTLADVGRSLPLGTATAGGVRVRGLRAGTASLVLGRGAIALGLRGYSYVRGVRVTGRLNVGLRTATGDLRVQGPPSVRGRVAFRHGRMVGTLGGRRVDEPAALTLGP